MDKVAFASLEPGWWLIEASAPSDVEALRKELEPALGSGWHQSKDKLEALYDTLASSGLVGDELDAATESDKQAAWLQKVVGVARPKHADPAAAEAAAPTHGGSGHDAGAHDAGAHEEASVPEAPPLTQQEIDSIAAAAGIDAADLEGIDLNEVEAEDVGDEEGPDEDEAE